MVMVKKKILLSQTRDELTSVEHIIPAFVRSATVFPEGMRPKRCCQASLKPIN
jgi:hypothetical protein